MSPISAQYPYLILSVSKYSFLAEPNGGSNPSWKHAHNAFLIFDSFRSNLESPSTKSDKCLKVVKGANTLECVDIEKKARESSAIIEKSKLLKAELTQDQIPSLALFCRSACSIAIRYPLTDNHLRKIQLKFNSAQDFDAALTALVELGLPSYECFPLSVEEALKAAHLTPTTAAPVVPQTTTSSSGVRREPMPSSAGGHSKALGIGSIGLPISGLPPSEIYFPSDHRSEERHSRLSQRPNTAISGPRSSNTQDLRPSTALPAPVRYGRGAEDFQLDTNMLQPRKSEVLRPRTSFSPAPTNNRNQDEMKSDLPPLPIPTNTSMDGTQGLTLHSSPRKLTQNTSDISNFPRSAPNTVPQTETTSLYFGRPSTAAGAQILSELHAEVPPRRELPFQRQSRPLAGNDALKSLNIPHTSFSALASSKDRNMVPNLTTSAGDAVDGRPAPLTGGLKHTSKAKTVDFVLDVDCPTRIGHYGSTYEALRDCPGNSKLADSQQQNLPAQAEQRLESISATEPLCGPTAKKPGCASDSETHETHIRQVLDRLMPYVGSARTDKESLASYTRLSNKERRTVIEDVVVDLIKDDNFAQLCEDLYGTWQRIGLGP